MQQTFARRHYRTVFLSDLHLGLRASRADLLLDFLEGTDCGRIVLVGDIVDGWRLRKSWFWDRSHDEVIRLLLRRAREGVEILYIPGNHDEMFRDWVGLEIAGIRLAQQAEHVTADGRRLLVMHGDEFDSVVRYWPLLAHLGDWAYDAALLLNRWFNIARRRMGYPYWSLSQWLKRRVKEAVKAIDRFEESLAHEALRGGYDGVICGHIHHAEMRDIGGVIYMNTGDWVESCTALVEHPDGRFELLDWSRRGAPARQSSVPRPAVTQDAAPDARSVTA